MNKQDNGNTQLNSIRNDFNDRLKDKIFMGQGKRMAWNDRRRYRTIQEKSCYSAVFFVYLSINKVNKGYV